ncbi:hypothetical protein ASPACDRAFT_1877518 [Aspergillus aculeatus ATCC 16872]|uniref:AB hydrolase-1 domain-containing protein n=1 Tax=Aspergillus aculeatus (strain ATCC 16872 / CBS 172.66 / WB 5094) TaxID=690307 RepID=A0A1L9WEM6_ASPA1|nr:uncharacterized protein ASPACDRAFT_1877518 [Aspergillus aculeatus ATCC 16872]OJJ94628.1 hypothetical protein ASPACDRAFT_1877518 [Aspergillus aculeatus ATCC 16872]
MMQSFKITMANNATMSGIRSFPVAATATARHVPLIVGLHGGTYNCQYFNATPRFSASATSASLGVPFIAIDRPGYGDTSSFPPLPEGSNFFVETGSWLHHHILPALWSEFGIPLGCTCIVLLCHSFGSMGGIVAAAKHGQDPAPAYPLGGLILSGIGDAQSEAMQNRPPPQPTADTGGVLFPLQFKDQVMFLPGTVDNEVLEHSARLNALSPPAEMQQFPGNWLPVWKQDWAIHVRAPVMFALVQNDVFFKATEEEVKTCTQAFRTSSRVDGSLIKGAPHCMELSYWSQGWYARCFGFALECATSFALAA